MQRSIPEFVTDPDAAAAATEADQESGATGRFWHQRARLRLLQIGKSVLPISNRFDY